MRCLSALVTVVLQIVMTDGAVNYCGARMCGRGDAHTYCRYRPGPSASCSGYVEAPLSGEERARVLARLNRRRSQLARGWLRWPSAGDMLKLRWIDELSREAQRWADQCRPPRTPEERDSCRDLYSISVGQCVASIVGEAPGLRPESMVDMWFMQSMLYDGNVTSYVPSRVKNYGDFAQMMWSRTYLVGCGRSRFMTEWQGRLRSVERLVCNFAPRGPVPSRPLWTPAEPASICPPRSRPDSLPGLCTYQNDVKELENFNVSMSPQDNYLLETVFELEKNESLDDLGRLDELYLTKIAIATIRTPMPVPLYYLQKRDVFENSETGDEQWSFGNKSEVADNSISTDQFASSPEPVTRTKSYTKTKVNIIGRPKPYDINELNDAIWESKMENPNVIQDLRRSKEKDIYAEYGLEVTDEDEIVNSSTTTAVLAKPIYNDTTTARDKSLEKNGSNEKSNSTDGMVGFEKDFTDVQDEMNDLIIGNKSVDDYLSDPETVRALQDALDQMEKTLASPRPTSTPGKVRRELRNLEADLQKATSTARDVPATSEASHRGSTKEENQAKDRAPMLNMVLKYMPYLKPYQDTIVGTARGDGSAVWCELSVVGFSFLLHVFVL